MVKIINNTKLNINSINHDNGKHFSQVNSSAEITLTKIILNLGLFLHYRYK